MASTQARATERELHKAKVKAGRRNRTRRPSRVPSFAELKRSISSLRRGSTPRLQKVVFLGDVEVGKTSVITRMTCNYFSTEYEPTMEELHDLKMNLRGMEEVVQILDTNGDPSVEVEGLRHRAIRQGNAFVVIFSVNNNASFERAGVLLEEILDGSKQLDITKLDLGRARRVLLVGNQADEDGDDGLSDTRDQELYSGAGVSGGGGGNARAVQAHQAWDLADQYGVTEYIEVSARSGLGVDSIERRLASLYQGRERSERGQDPGQAEPSFLKKVTSFLQPSSSTRDGTLDKRKASRSTLSPASPPRSRTTSNATLTHTGCKVAAAAATPDTTTTTAAASGDGVASGGDPPPFKRGGLRASLGKALGRKKRKWEPATSPATDAAPTGEVTLFHSAL